MCPYGCHWSIPRSFEEPSKTHSGCTFYPFNTNFSTSSQSQSGNKWNHPRNVFMKKVVGNGITKLLRSFIFLQHYQAIISFHLSYTGFSCHINTLTQLHSPSLMMSVRVEVSAWRRACVHTPARASAPTGLAYHFTEQSGAPSQQQTEEEEAAGSQRLDRYLWMLDNSWRSR